MPVALHPQVLDPASPFVQPQGQVVCREELADGGVNGAGGGDVAVGEEGVDRLWVDLARHLGVLDQRLQLGGEAERVAAEAVEEGLLADPVAGQEEALATGIPEREGKIADQTVERALAPAVEALEQNGGIADLPGLFRRQAQRRNQVVPVVEPDVGNENQAAVAAL